MAAREPPANTSHEAVRLREAALAFARHANRAPVDDHDREGQRLNRNLLRAALSYGVAVNPPPNSPCKHCDLPRRLHVIGCCMPGARKR